VQKIQNKNVIGVSRKVLLIGAFLFVLLFAQSAGAQEIILKNIYYYQPPMDGSGLLASYGSEAIGHFGFHLGVFGDRAEQPLEWTDPEAATHILIYDQTAINPMFGIGILDRINVAAVFPVAVNRKFDEEYKGKIPRRVRNEDTGLYETKLIKVDEKWEETAMSDARVMAKYMFTHRKFDGYGLAGMVEVGLGNGDKAQFVSDQQMTVAPRFIFDLGNTWWSYVLNVAYKYYPDPLEAGMFDIEGGNELILSTGGTLRVWYGLEFIAEFQTRTLMERFYSNDNVDYGEGLFGIRSTWGVRNPVRVTLGGGFGALDGIGTPLYRLFFGVDMFIRELGMPK